MNLLSLCIDFGSTFVKFLVLNKTDLIFEDKLEFPKPCIDNGKAYEVSIKNIDETVYKIFEIVKEFSIKKCYIAVQMHGYVLKYPDGTFSNYVSWKDKSGDISNEHFKNINFQKNGTSLKSNLPAVKLFFKKNETDFTFFTLGSYISSLLTGKNITHKTDACASGFFDADTLAPIILDNNSLPTVTHTVIPVGVYNGIEIYTPVGDHQLSYLGSGAGEDAYLLNIGTATQLSTLADNFEFEADFEKRPYFNTKRLLTVSGLTGGEKLYNGYDTEDFLSEIMEAVKKMPLKSKMLVGGGGAELVFDKLNLYFKEHKIQCYRLKSSISTEGMKKLCEAKTVKIGTMLSEVCFSNFPIILKNNEMDFFILDNEHGAFDYSFISSIVTVSRLVDLPIIVRLPDNNRKDITKLVDMGVTGFLLPMTNTAEDIKKVIDFAKYSPIGKRGISTNRAHTFYNPPPIDEYMIEANKKVKVYAQIETANGLANIDEILNVNGIDGVFVGPNDLSCDLGCIGNNEPIFKAIKTVSRSAKNNRKKWGIITTSKNLINCSLENGVNYISYGSEINMLKDSCKKIRSNIYDK